MKKMEIGPGHVLLQEDDLSVSSASDRFRDCQAFSVAHVEICRRSMVKLQKAAARGVLKRQ